MKKISGKTLSKYTYIKIKMDSKLNFTIHLMKFSPNRWFSNKEQQIHHLKFFIKPDRILKKNWLKNSKKHYTKWFKQKYSHGKATWLASSQNNQTREL